ncbi:MAG: FkbM family methyltransferase [Proteobacteria bacterium]|nr:FkbM family methyltransferase [Pseudomonadota bacterium]
MAIRLRRLARGAARRLGFHVSSLEGLPWGASKFVDAAALIPQPQIIFDVGANAGQTVAELREVFPTAQIYSFEPIPATFEKLKRNTIKDLRCEAINIAMGAVSGSLKMTAGPIDGQNTANVSAKPDAPTVEVSVQTVDGFCAERGIGRIDLLKIDTEGFEMSVLTGAANMLGSGKIKMVLAECEFEPNPAEPHGNFFEIYARMQQAGLRLVSFYTGGVDGNGWRWGDALFARTADRLTTCSPYTVHKATSTGGLS